MYPFNHKMGQKIQTDAPGVNVDRTFLAHLAISAADAIAASNTAVLAAQTLATGTTTNIVTGITNQSIPRCLRIVGNQAGINGNVVITGTDYGGNVITETITANGTTPVDGNKAFKTITGILLPQRNAAGDTISVGFNEKLGLPYKLPHNTVRDAYLNNIKESTTPTVAVSATALESNTIKLNSTLNGSVVDIYLVV